ncbi:hypothetical protein OQX63_22720 [Pedobacter sp. PF22-3]|uniref:hypothetical protein n=1 Tax=Pedobacter sp. PF22-3 TaxID=2994467 RepID=UPI0022452C29|nr:hypothetical protein [Pedobacter sp. PF22-3]MCX2496325.1 hypothetical protein [Pedobacter sp. PF22-3]
MHQSVALNISYILFLYTKLYDKSYVQRDLNPRNSAVAAMPFFPSEKLRIGYGYEFSIGPLRGYSAEIRRFPLLIYLLNKIQDCCAQGILS